MLKLKILSLINLTNLDDLDIYAQSKIAYIREN